MNVLSAVTGPPTAAAINLFSKEKYVKYNDPGVEPPVENEAKLETELHEIISRVIKRNLDKHGHGYRATHVKTQAVVKGTFTVAPDLPDYLAQGICSAENAKTDHPVAIRFANEPSFLQDDRASGPRGCSMKVFNVEGKYMDQNGEQTQTHDMMFNNAPILELRDLPNTVEIFKVREAHFDNPYKSLYYLSSRTNILRDEIAAIMKTRSDAALQMAPSQLPNQHFLSYTMYSQSAYRWGDYIAKYALFPSTSLQKKLGATLTRLKITDNSDPEQHRIWLREYFAENEAEYELKVQLCQTIREQSVEDTGLPWVEMAFPFQTVGHVRLYKQESFDKERVKFWEDSMKLNPWYGLEAHRPLGSVNRLRRKLYEMSAARRQEINGKKVQNIKSIDELP